MATLVAVLAVTDDGMIPLVEQYRIANHRWTLEIPAGHANNPSERPTDVAKRKLAEEAGFDSHQAYAVHPFYEHAELFHPAHRNLLRHRSNPGFPSGNRPETPRSDVRMVSVDDAYEMVVNGTIVDARPWSPFCA